MKNNKYIKIHLYRLFFEKLNNSFFEKNFIFFSSYNIKNDIETP